MLFHRRQHAQIALDTSRVVIANILLDHLNKLVLAGEPSAVIAFPFQDAPEDAMPAPKATKLAIINYSFL